MLLTVPGDAPLSAATLLDVLAAGTSSTDPIVVAAAGFDTGGLSVADAYGVDLVGRAALASLEAPAVDAGSLDK